MEEQTNHKSNIWAHIFRELKIDSSKKIQYITSRLFGLSQPRKKYLLGVS